jgi:hypothetical protein
MGSRRRRLNELSHTEVAEILERAEALHHAPCRPMVAVSGEHYAATHDCAESIRTMVTRITGDDTMPWVRRSIAVSRPS